MPTYSEIKRITIILCQYYNSLEIKIGTTDVILDEAEKNKNIKISDKIKIYNTGKISNDIKDLKTNYLKQPSKADLSLVQAAIKHAEIKGIITFDKGFLTNCNKRHDTEEILIKFLAGKCK